MAEHEQIILNIARTKCIICGSRNALADATVLNSSIDVTSVEQVTKTMLLGVNLSVGLIRLIKLFPRWGKASLFEGNVLHMFRPLL